MNESEKEMYLLHSMLPAFKRKVQKSLSIIREALRIDGVKWSASVSFGKDSIVMLDLIHQVTDSIPVYFMDSDYKLPDIYETIELLQERYKLNISKSYFADRRPIQEVWEKFGVPGINRTTSMQNKALKVLKKDVSDRWAKEHGFNGIFWGIRKQESQQRKWMVTTFGVTFENKQGFYRCAPLADWKARDVWAYIVSHDLPYPKLYDYQKFQTRDWIRNTGWATTDGAAYGRILWLREFYPDYYEKLEWMLPEIKAYL
jgi:phosphoadenosine phosphosulfate reductase